MNKLNQMTRCHRILDARRTFISTRDLAERLECTERTAKRYIEDLQSFWDAPIEHSPRQGWRYDPTTRDKWQVPGMWMTREETQSLLLLLDILNRFGNGLLDDELRAVRGHVDRLLERRGVSRKELERKIRIVPVGQRALPDHRLHHVLNALVDGKRLEIRYRNFAQKPTRRVVSPLRLMYYRDNWYMDAWCHWRDALRTFSLARIEHSNADNEAAITVDDEVLDAHVKSTYGVFSGEASQTATLRFLPRIAKEIAIQHWHPQQEGRWQKQDYVLKIPYSDPTELLQDIFRYMPDVVVEGPESLRELVIGRLEEAARLHAEP